MYIDTSRYILIYSSLIMNREQMHEQMTNETILSDNNFFA